MADYQRTVDDIRSFLQSSDQTFRESLRDLATAYADCCQEVNERLRRCEEFLQRGLRSEAVHFAQAEPVLLDAVTLLDFPERGRWEEVSVSYALAPAPPLRLATAAALNRAYTEEQPLEHLLRQHRLLALARAPLAERLAVIRQVGRLDAANPVWTEQAAEFERVRHRQLQDEFSAALARDDMEAIFALSDEVRKAPWQAPPPAALVEQVSRAVAQRANERLRKECGRVALQLATAFAAYDEPKVRELRDVWTELNREARLTPEDPLSRRVVPALRWLAQQDRKQGLELAQQAALEKLEKALARNARAAELETLFDAAREIGVVPAALEQRYQGRLDSLQRRARWRERVILMATFSLGVLGLVALIVLMALRKKK